MHKTKNIGEFASQIYQHWQATQWNKKHCRIIAKTFVEQIWYINNVLKTFPDATLEIDNEFLCIKYAKGSGRINISYLELDVFIPEVEAVCYKYGKKLIRPSLFIAA